MGWFLSLSGVIGKTEAQVADSLRKYAESVGGGISKEAVDSENENCCSIVEENGNSTVFNPYAFMEWDDSSQFISQDLNATVFSFHIHDSDLWMYIMYVNGEQVDQFNPVPDYWEENVSDEEIESWRGNATTIAKYIPSIKKEDIENYLVRWDLDAEEATKAYPDDEYTQEEYQLFDFMKTLKLPNPVGEDGTPTGVLYKLWTNKLPLKSQNQPSTKELQGKEKLRPWWKFW